MEIVLWVLAILTVLVSAVCTYIYVFKDKSDYKKAKDEIFPFVKSYYKKCTGANRFVVTVSTLQDCFRHYDTETINKVWLDLIKEHVIEKDPMDDEWCVRKHGG